MYVKRSLPKIDSVSAVEILDSRGNPTVSVTLALSDGSVGVATAPSGASTGKHEAHEKRDGEKSRYGGKGVLQAVNSVNYAIAEVLTKTEKRGQIEIDRALCELDATENKTRLGANATLPVSMAYARACAEHYGLPLYLYLGGVVGGHADLPMPMMNVLNGGAHSKNNVDIQEFMIVPMGIEKHAERVRACAEIYHALGQILSSRGYATSVGDEGGYAPMLERDEEAIELILEAIAEAGYYDFVKLALDAAASEWSVGDNYRLPKRGREYDTDGLISYWQSLCRQYPIISIEDGLGEDDIDGWHRMTTSLGGRIMLVGDDLFVTNSSRVEDGIRRGYANALLIKPNQAGTVTETLSASLMARAAGYSLVVSHRSGESGDAFISDLAVALGAGFIKAGAPCRGERVAKYNRLTKIAYEMGEALHDVSGKVAALKGGAESRCTPDGCFL